MKKVIILVLTTITIFLISCSKSIHDKEYGVFLGVEDVSNIRGYDLIVVDAYYLNDKIIKKLHENNKKVYTYLNIGTLENFRDCYEDFKDDTFDVYDDWPEEHWMNVSNLKWQSYIQSKAELYKNMGIDGFFIDNTDVYGLYSTDKIYDGLVNIINNLHKLELDISINGGDVFVKKAIKENDIKITAINQETVFSAINFKNKTLGKSTKENEEYYKKYLKFAKDNDIMVYLLEYTTNKDIINNIKKYCEDNGFKYYISSSIELTN